MKEKIGRKKFEKLLLKQEIELVKLQEWVKANKLKVVVVFEGRDAAGKGGVIKTIAGCLNPRICRIVALGIPTEKEKSQWYFQRYVNHLPAGGEIVLFDRSWYNRAGGEKGMGYCTSMKSFSDHVPSSKECSSDQGSSLLNTGFLSATMSRKNGFRTGFRIRQNVGKSVRWM